jgi:predicted ATPase/class 3 adenylate cyclase/DNA-binding CsgD family transcriptional regulator
VTELRAPRQHLGADRLLGESTLSDPGPEPSTFLLPTGTVTFLLTDVAQSTATWEAAPEAMAKAISRHYEILADAVARNHGVRPTEQGEGDSIVAAFSRGADAVAAALDAQRGLADEPWPAGAELSVRMALHTGDAQQRDAFNYFGQTVIRAARLRALAHGGQVIASRATRDLVSDQLPAGARWRDLGVHRLKDLGRPENVFQLEHPALASDFPPLVGLNESRTNLPGQLSSFIGRERELAEAGQLLDEHRLLTVTGAGGCGKTRLALQLAADRSDRFDDGVWYVELAAVTGSGTVARQLADVLRVSDEPQVPLVSSLVERLRRQSVLLVLDNCEHVVDQCAELIDAVTRQCGGVRVLATSRQVLDVAGEVMWRLPSMGLPPDGSDTLVDALGTYDAIRLFCERAARSRPGFALESSNAVRIASICRRLDGIPLAIELAAARVRTLGLDDIGRGLDDRFRLLTGGARTALPRQQTLAASVDWSHDLLDVDDQRLFAELAVFAGAFTLDAARSVATGDAAAITDGLAALVDRSLVNLDDSEESSRYRYLETVKAYGRRRLAESGDEPATRDRHLAHHLDVAERSEEGILGLDQGRWLNRLDREHDDLRSALDWASASFSVDSLYRLAYALQPYWHTRGHSREAQGWYDRLLAEAPDAPPALRARVLWASSYLAVYADDMALCAERSNAALQLARECGDERTIGRALDTTATMRQYADPAGTQSDFFEAAAYAERNGDTWCRIDALQKAAFSDWYRDRWPDALSLAEQAVEGARVLDNHFFLSWHESLVGMSALRAGDHEQAERMLRAALYHAAGHGEATTVVVPATLLGWSAMRRGDDAAAAAVHRELLDLLGDNARAGFAMVQIGFIDAAAFLRAGDDAKALEFLTFIVDVVRSEGMLYPLSIYLSFLGMAQVGVGDLDAAAATAEAQHRSASRLQSEVADASAHLLDAVVQRRLGRADLADQSARQALTALLRSGIRPDAVDALAVLAGCVLDLGNATQAARLLGAVQALRVEHGWLGDFPTAINAQSELDVQEIIETLGEDGPGRLADGAKLSLEEAYEQAMRSHGTRSRPTAGWASLTPTELQVVEQVRQGRTNPEIAQALFMARSTVKTHVSHSLTKLGVSTRAELAAEAARHESP